MVMWALSKTSPTVQFTVSYDATEDYELDWYEYTLAFGMPCFHASLILVYLNHQYKQFDQKTWNFCLPKWYSTIFHVKTYQKQYEATLHVPADTVQLVSQQCYPPLVSVAAGRPRKNRFTSRPKDGASSSAELA
jgi:hypothetical protein